MSDLEKTAIERLRMAAQMSEKLYKAPLIVTTSGGKDSSVCVELARRAGIPFEVQHNLTTADAPETVRFVRAEFARLESLGIPCQINHPMYKGKRVSMWSLIPQKLMPPTRTVRYCCDVLKEQGGKGRFITTGVRWAESTKRKNSRGVYEAISSDIKKTLILNSDNDEKRMLFEICLLKEKRICNPIIDWTEAQVWDFLRSEKVPVNPLYSCGFSRVGCIGCPLSSKKKRQTEFARYPKYEAAYIRAFDKMLVERQRKGRDSPTWKSGMDVFNWWMGNGVIPGQMTMEEVLEGDADA